MKKFGLFVSFFLSIVFSLYVCSSFKPTNVNAYSPSVIPSLASNDNVSLESSTLDASSFNSDNLHYSSKHSDTGQLNNVFTYYDESTFDVKNMDFSVNGCYYTTSSFGVKKDSSIIVQFETAGYNSAYHNHSIIKPFICLPGFDGNNETYLNMWNNMLLISLDSEVINIHRKDGDQANTISPCFITADGLGDPIPGNSVQHLCFLKNCTWRLVFNCDGSLFIYVSIGNHENDVSFPGHPTNMGLKSYCYFKAGSLRYNPASTFKFALFGNTLLPSSTSQSFLRIRNMKLAYANKHTISQNTNELLNNNLNGFNWFSNQVTTTAHPDGKKFGNVSFMCCGKNFGEVPTLYTGAYSGYTGGSFTPSINYVSPSINVNSTGTYEHDALILDKPIYDNPDSPTISFTKTDLSNPSKFKEGNSYLVPYVIGDTLDTRLVGKITFSANITSVSFNGKFIGLSFGGTKTLPGNVFFGYGGTDGTGGSPPTVYFTMFHDYKSGNQRKNTTGFGGTFTGEHTFIIHIFKVINETSTYPYFWTIDSDVTTESLLADFEDFNMEGTVGITSHQYLIAGGTASSQIRSIKVETYSHWKTVKNISDIQTGDLVYLGDLRRRRIASTTTYINDEYYFLKYENMYDSKNRKENRSDYYEIKNGAFIVEKDGDKIFLKRYYSDDGTEKYLGRFDPQGNGRGKVTFVEKSQALPFTIEFLNDSGDAKLYINYDSSDNSKFDRLASHYGTEGTGGIVYESGFGGTSPAPLNIFVQLAHRGLNDICGENYLQMNSYDPTLSGKGGDGRCWGCYRNTKDKLLSLGEDAIYSIQNDIAFKNARERYERWSTFNGDTEPYESSEFDQQNPNSSNGLKHATQNNASFIIIISGFAIIGILFNIFIIKRKKYLKS